MALHALRLSYDVQERLVPFSMGAYRTDIFVREVRPPRRRVMGGSVSFPDELPSLPPAFGVFSTYVALYRRCQIVGR